ncbi:MAG TPA: LacI family DNA-binding transcriptional regulator [Streptosporangiaceae bacterium]|jgi:DNA-binding LacI/PurR family transcriptional regulator
MAGQEHMGRGQAIAPATISEVAAAAGVSRQTVSNVLNAPARVAPETAARVRQAIEQLGYRPNRAARNLRARASRNIGFKIHSPAGVSNLLDRFLHALAEAAGGGGYHVLIFAPAPVEEELAAYEDLIRTGTVDGFVLADVALRDPRLPWFAQQGIPFVCFGRPWGHEHDKFAWADVDGAYGVAQAVDHLVSLGHRRIAYLGWPEGTGFGDERRTGWRDAMRRHGAMPEGLDGSCQEDVATATGAARRLLALPDPPTAFACGSDTFAVAARLAGGVNPAGQPNVEVVGFDDSPAAMLMSPPMSSVRQPVQEAAQHVVGLLLNQLHGSGIPGEGVMLRPQLVSRGLSRPDHGG